MDRYQYLLLMGACVLVTLPLEFVFGARVWRRPRRLLIALVPTLVIFLVWDVWAIERGQWTYGSRWVSGIELPGSLPLEELVFFVVIPVCGLLTYEAVGRMLAGQRPWRRSRELS